MCAEMIENKNFYSFSAELTPEVPLSGFELGACEEPAGFCELVSGFEEGLSGLLLDGVWDDGGVSCCCDELVETGFVEEVFCLSSVFSFTVPGCLRFLEVLPGSPAPT